MSFNLDGQHRDRNATTTATATTSATAATSTPFDKVDSSPAAEPPR